MKITDLKCAVIGRHPFVRVVTDEGISGYGQVELYKPYLKHHVLVYRRRAPWRGPDERRTGHAQHPPLRRVQTMGQRRQRGRDGALGCGR